MDISNNILAEINFAINALIVELDDTCCIDTIRRRWIADALTDLIAAAASKFIAGQVEHQDNFEDIDGPSESLKEFVDAFFYLRKCTHPINIYAPATDNTPTNHTDQIHRKRKGTS
jgi:hypothetical protein